MDEECERYFLGYFTDSNMRSHVGIKAMHQLNPISNLHTFTQTKKSNLTFKI